MKILTADYKDGVKWVYENKKGKNVFIMLGSNFGNFKDEQIIQLMSWLKQFFRKGDMAIIGLDMKKNPEVIYKAYST